MSLLLYYVHRPDEEVLCHFLVVVYRGQMRRCCVISTLCCVQRPVEEVMGHFLFVLCKEAR